MQCKAMFNISYIPAESQIWWKLPCFLPVVLTSDMWMWFSSGSVHTNVSASSTVGQIPTCNRITLIAHQLSSRSEIILRSQMQELLDPCAMYVPISWAFPFFSLWWQKLSPWWFIFLFAFSRGLRKALPSSSLALLANALPPLHSQRASAPLVWLVVGPASSPRSQWRVCVCACVCIHVCVRAHGLG